VAELRTKDPGINHGKGDIPVIGVVRPKGQTKEIMGKKGTPDMNNTSETWPKGCDICDGRHLCNHQNVRLLTKHEATNETPFGINTPVGLSE